MCSVVCSIGVGGDEVWYTTTREWQVTIIGVVRVIETPEVGVREARRWLEQMKWRGGRRQRLWSTVGGGVIGFRRLRSTVIRGSHGGREEWMAGFSDDKPPRWSLEDTTNAESDDRHDGSDERNTAGTSSSHSQSESDF